jgi:hypothetical protein
MRHIKEYSEYADGIEISDIEDCFRDLLDMDIHLDISIPRASSLGFGTPAFSKIFEVSMRLDDKAVPADRQKESEFGAMYRPVYRGKEIADLFAEGVDKCAGVLDLEIYRAEIEWTNAGEWAYLRRRKGLPDIGKGPGMMGSVFRHDDASAARDLDRAIAEKGDRLRHAAVYFSKSYR